MPLLGEKDRRFLQAHLAKAMEKPVKLLFFTQTIACQFCRETEELLREVSSLSDKIGLEVYNLITDAEMAERYGVDKIPATVVMSDQDYGVRFYGIPSGYEFTSLIEDIVDVSRGAPELSAETRQALARIQQDVHLQVFVTPTCPYCPDAVHLAHSLAIASERIKADMVEAVEFPQLAIKYGVQGVPKTVINESVAVEGAAPEPLLVARILDALGLLTEEERRTLQQRFGSTEEAGATE
ncbi:MAG: thioredoxin family protein [Chloroflexi bacterium]|nr:thioredoxin family protein [Chloroflexota bacterium]